MSGRYAKQTDVPVSRTRAEIEECLVKYGADAFGSMQEIGMAYLVFRIENRHVKLMVPLPDPQERRFTHMSPPRAYQERSASAQQELYNQA